MNNRASRKTRAVILSVFAVLCLLLSSLFFVTASAQSLTEKFVADPVEEVWKAPDLADLPGDWWARFNTGSADQINTRFDKFLATIEQRISGLVGDELVTAQNEIAQLKSSYELLTLARQGPGDTEFDQPLTKETYFLDDVLELRAQGRVLETRAARLELQIEQTDIQITLLQERRDKLISRYEAEDPEAPARILTAIKRITGRVEYELATVQLKNSEQLLKDVKAQAERVNEQQKFARSHLVVDENALAVIQDSIVDARAQVTESSRKVAALQSQLLDALSATTVKPSLELLRKQQLTRASAESELAQLQETLLDGKYNWYLLRTGNLDAGFDLEAVMEKIRRITADSLKQASLWSSVSQATLGAASTETNLNALKNVEIARSVARDTLGVIDQIKSTSENLLIIEDILAQEVLANRKGLGNTGARLVIFLDNTREKLVDLADFHLFNIGDTSVTPSGLFKMLMILALAIGVSWFIRHLLARGIGRRRAAQSPAFYTLGRILHYVIIMAGIFAALGSIGIDFTSFALIAGALSVGIGFGLQAIVSNFVSGLILLFEGTLRVGDFIEMESGLRGVVKEINTRATVINTNDAVDLVVPNSQLVTTQLTNWTLRESYARLRVSFGVAYGSDKELVRDLSYEAVSKVENALTNMPGLEPQVRLSNFGDSALEFTVLFWVSRQGVRRPGRTRANFLWELETLLREHGVEIPFPQRDIHFKNQFRQDEILVPVKDSPGEQV
jgi:small-conductance mechanosensitive channel